MKHRIGQTLLLSLLAFAFVSFISPARTLALAPGTLVALTNQQRAAAGLSPLTVNSQLMSSAYAKAQDMIARNYWAHFAPDGTSPWAFISGSGYQYVGAGENLAMDFATDEDVMAGWMNSPTHRANILNPNYIDVGIAVVEGQLEGHDTFVVVAHYGTPAHAAAPTPAPAPVASTPAPVVETPVAETVPEPEPAPTVLGQTEETKVSTAPQHASASSKKPAYTESKAFTFLKIGLIQLWLTPLFKYRDFS